MIRRLLSRLRPRRVEPLTADDFVSVTDAYVLRSMLDAVRRDEDPLTAGQVALARIRADTERILGR